MVSVESKCCTLLFETFQTVSKCLAHTCGFLRFLNFPPLRGMAEPDVHTGKFRAQFFFFAFRIDEAYQEFL